jgi:hypothetical protein
MAVKYWALATEDALSEAVGRRLLAELPDVEVTAALRKGGRGYLRMRMSSWRQIAHRQGMLVLTDLDLIDCPPTLLRDWLAGKGAPPGLLLRIAVRTIESWVLADHAAMRQLIGPNVALPARPDELRDPKQHLLKLAQHARRDVRLDLVKQAGTIASQGIGYNTRLTEWVTSTWSPVRAAERSPSLRRTRARLRERDAHMSLLP